MGVTTVKAIVNMRPDIIVHLVEVGRNAPPQYPGGVSVDHPPLFGKVARPMDVTGEMAIRVPWCTSQEDFDNLHLVVQFIDPVQAPWATGASPTFRSGSRNGMEQISFDLPLTVPSEKAEGLSLIATHEPCTIRGLGPT